MKEAQRYHFDSNYAEGEKKSGKIWSQIPWQPYRWNMREIHSILKYSLLVITGKEFMSL